jgi:iron complex outermembrane recepter protein
MDFTVHAPSPFHPQGARAVSNHLSLQVHRPARVLTPVAAAACLALLPGSLWAQAVSPPAAAASAPESAKNQPEAQQIIVTGTGRRETASKVPFNITAINQQTLREENITDVKRLLRDSIAISAPENSARFADSVTVRGLNVSPVNANNIEQFVRSTLSYYLDDTPLPNIAYRIKDVARVETLLGPQGTLYGAGSLGGTVRYITNKPRLGATEAVVNTSFYQSQYGGLSNDTDVVLNLPIGQNLALRASVAKLDEKGSIDRVSNPPWRQGADAWVTQPDAKTNVYENDDWQRVTGGRFSLLWRAAKGFDITLAHTQQKQLANGTTAVSLLPLGVANARNPAEVQTAWKNPQWALKDLPCFPNCTYRDESKYPVAVNDHSILSRYAEFADRRFNLDSIDVDVDLGFATLHSSTSQFKDSRIGQADYASQGQAFYFSFGDLGGKITSGRSAYITFDNTYKGISHETRLTSKGDGPLSWIAGLYHTKQDKSLKFSEVLPGMDAYLGADKATKSPLPDVGYSEDLASKYKETAVFGEASYKITEPWTLTLGGRLFNYTDTAKAKIVDYAGGFVDSDYTASGGTNGKSFYKVNTAYQLNNNLLAYVTLSQGFRRGGTNGFKDLGAKIVAADAREYQPDSTNNFELGVKGYLFDRSLYVEASVYRIDWKNAQTYRSQTINDFPINGTANGPDARTQGFEFSTRYRITPQWLVTYSNATTQGEWVSTKTHCIYADASSCRTWSEGGKLGGAPKWKHNLGLRFETSFGDDYAFWAKASARYRSELASDRSDSPLDNSSVATLPAVTRFNASVGLSKDAWDANLWIDNLSNVRKVVSGQTGGLMGPRVIYTTPRTVGLNFSYKFF